MASTAVQEWWSDQSTRYRRAIKLCVSNVLHRRRAKTVTLMLIFECDLNFVSFLFVNFCDEAIKSWIVRRSQGFNTEFVESTSLFGTLTISGFGKSPCFTFRKHCSASKTWQREIKVALAHHWRRFLNFASDLLSEFLSKCFTVNS